jgi:hypothetical protein
VVHDTVKSAHEDTGRNSHRTLVRPPARGRMSHLHSGLDAVFSSRLVLFLCSFAYSAVLLYCLSQYASAQWDQYGYSYGRLDWIDVLLVVGGLGLWSLVLPLSMSTASSVILVLVYFSVCVPGLVVPLALERVADEQYYHLSVILVVSFAAACALVRRFVTSDASAVRKCPAAFVYAIVAAWLFCLALLVATYGSVMTLVSLDAIYEQRAVGAATSRFMGYVQTYFAYVLSPALLAFGLLRKNFLLVGAGFAGGLVLYSITAEKNAFAIPYLMVGFNFLLTRRGTLHRSVAFVLLVLGSVLGIAVLLNEDSLVAAFLAWYIGVRSLLTPGLFVAQYLDFFSERGFTYLSHVSGIGWLISPPPTLLADGRWPSIGHMVGEQYIGIPDLNANASFVASDGIASFGAAGIGIAFLLLAAYLIALERAARGIAKRFVMLIAMPIGLLLTNVSLLTVILSFGGLFWLLSMHFIFKPDGRVAKDCQPR